MGIVEIFLISFFIIGLSLVGMAAGVLMKRSPIKGSCGGLNNVLGGEEVSCPICSDTGECKNDKKKEA